MLTTTDCDTTRACLISARCPSCSAPIVGTRPTGPVELRQRAGQVGARVREIGHESTSNTAAVAASSSIPAACARSAVRRAIAR